MRHRTKAHGRENPGEMQDRTTSLVVLKLFQNNLLRVLVACLVMGGAAWLAVSGISPASAGLSSQRLWATQQHCAQNMLHPEYSVDGLIQGFDEKTAFCSLSPLDPQAAWEVSGFSPVPDKEFNRPQLEIAFLVAGWQITDTLRLDLTLDGGRNWEKIVDYSRTNPPPAILDHKTYDLSEFVHARQDLAALQIRLARPDPAPRGKPLDISLDGVAINITTVTVPTEVPTSTPNEGAAQAATEPAVSKASQAAPPTATPVTAGAGTPAAGGSATPRARPTNTPWAPASTRVYVTATPGPTSQVIPTSTPAAPLQLRVGPSDSVQALWALEQTCDFPLSNPAGSLDDAFNNQAAVCSGFFASAKAGWQLSALHHATFTHIQDAILQIRFSLAGWVDDRIDLQIFDGADWVVLDRFEPGKSVPPAQLTTLAYNIAQYVNSPEKINQAAVRLVGVQVNGTPDMLTISLDGSQIMVSGGSVGMMTAGALPTPASQLPLIINAPLPGEPHSDISPLTDGCGACHNGHSAVAQHLRDSAPEEAVCFKCHAAGGPGTSVQASFTKYTNTATSFFSHNIMNTNGVHQLNESGAVNFGGANRHVECEDCHNPHRSNRNVAAAPMAQGEMNSVSGVDPVWSGAGAPASYTWLTAATREFQVCLKCHSSFTTLPSYVPDGWNGTAIVANGLRKLTSALTTQVLDSRDLAVEFNPSQTSFHPVIAQGRNQAISVASFVNGWTQTSMVYCSDCHHNPNGATEGAGPHGSPLLHILNGTTNYSTVTVNNAPVVPNSQVCFTCHSYAVYVTNSNSSTHFNLHSYHMNKSWGTTCYTCHSSHGSEQQHLINFDASVVTPMGGRNSQTAWYYDPATGSAGCWLTCHGQGHDPKTYTP